MSFFQVAVQNMCDLKTSAFCKIKKDREVCKSKAQMTMVLGREEHTSILMHRNQLQRLNAL